MSILQQLWYGRFPWLLPLYPLEWLFRRLAGRRRRAYSSGVKESWKAPVPVIIVGNISVGGVGKTPLVIALVEMLQEAGFKPGVVSRGYGARAPAYPLVVNEQTPVTHCGDEPLLIAQRCGCPLVVDPVRVSACRQLLQQGAVDVIIADDGLQHYALQRDLEICVIDAARGLGNGHCLPVGPLREPESRLLSVDYCIVNGDGMDRPNSTRMRLEAAPLCALDGTLASVIPSRVNAVAGIGNPERFFETLRGLGFDPVPRVFADHHDYQSSDLQFDDNLPLIMTEKDAVKCRAFNSDNRYYLPVNAVLPEAFRSELLADIRACSGVGSATD